MLCSSRRGKTVKCVVANMGFLSGCPLPSAIHHDSTNLGVSTKQALDHDPEEELAVLDQLIEWHRQTGEYGDAAK